ncbi:MAG: CIA30 family protein, partial [Candidatus Aminicenantes bacterium]|nr:CIA30 family protein [Candidatus Aminicenantes bacterium]
VLDQLNNEGKYLGIYALDAHAKIPLTKKISLNFPSYESIFGTLNVYVKTGSPLTSDPTLSSKQIIECIKKGRFFNVIEAISPANGFEIVYRSSLGNIHETGGSISDSTGTILLTLPFDFPVRIKIIKDGKEYFVNRLEPSTNAQVKINEPGVYRCEIYADTGKFKKLPWIATNPFFLNIKEKEKDKQDQILFTKAVFDQIEPFKVEKNNSSSGSIEYKNQENGEKSIILNYVLKGESGERDYWVSLAARESIDLSDFTGISFETRSSEQMRYWLEVRTKSGEEESWYRHSFLSTPEWNRIVIPFGKMVLIYGEMESRIIDQSRIGSLFISINNSIVNFPETKGWIDLKNISSYK